jgi:hypothetical protein
METSNIVTSTVGVTNYPRLTRKRSIDFGPVFQQYPVMIAGKPHYYVHFSKFVAVAKIFDSEWSISAVHVAFFGKFRLFSRNFCGKGFPDRVHLGYQSKDDMSRLSRK